MNSERLVDAAKKTVAPDDLVGQPVAIWDPEAKGKTPCKGRFTWADITAYDSHGRTHTVQFETGAVEDIRLSEVTWEWLQRPTVTHYKGVELQLHPSNKTGYAQVEVDPRILPFKRDGTPSLRYRISRTAKWIGAASDTPGVRGGIGVFANAAKAAYHVAQARLRPIPSGQPPRKQRTTHAGGWIPASDGRRDCDTEATRKAQERGVGGWRLTHTCSPV